MSKHKCKIVKDNISHCLNIKTAVDIRGVASKEGKNIRFRNLTTNTKTQSNREYRR